MSKHILIVGNITEAVEILNSASVGTKSTSFLKKDNEVYIEVLDYWTNLIKIFFHIPGKEYDVKGVDLIYKSPKDNQEKLIDIKTQGDILDAKNDISRPSLHLYMREFHPDKIQGRNYIIFNKNNNTLFGSIYFVNSEIIHALFSDGFFKDFLEQLLPFENLTQKYIDADTVLSKKFQTIKKNFHNTTFQVLGQSFEITFLVPRKDAQGVSGNTNFRENIRLAILL